MHLVGFTIEVYYDARLYERQTISYLYSWHRFVIREQQEGAKTVSQAKFCILLLIATCFDFREK